jgi:hypothetical protein
MPFLKALSPSSSYTLAKLGDKFRIDSATTSYFFSDGKLWSYNLQTFDWNELTQFDLAPCEWRIIKNPFIDKVAIQHDMWHSKRDLRIFADSY